MRILKMNLGLLAVLMLFAGTSLFAQQEQEKKKKIVIITKTVDADGNVKTEKIVREGEDADVFIMKQKDGKSERHENINVDVDDRDGQKKVRLRIDKKGKEGVEVIEWDGEGDLPENLRKTLEEKGIELEMIGDDNVFHIDTHDAPNEACLGVMIGKKESIENVNGEETVVIEGESDLGVPILDIIEASGAQDAGLIKDDIIAKINGVEVITMGEMLEVLSPLAIGDVISIDYVREGGSAQVNATLKACSDQAVEEVEEEIVLEVDEDSENRGMALVGKNTLDLESIDIFPNPTEGKLRIEFVAPAVATTLKIVDLSGREVYSENLINFDGKYNKEIDLSSMAKGALILSVQQADKVFSEKLILQR